MLRSTLILACLGVGFAAEGLWEVEEHLIGAALLRGSADAAGAERRGPGSHSVLKQAAEAPRHGLPGGGPPEAALWNRVNGSLPQRAEAVQAVTADAPYVCLPTCAPGPEPCESQMLFLMRANCNRVKWAKEHFHDFAASLSEKKRRHWEERVADAENLCLQAEKLKDHDARAAADKALHAWGEHIANRRECCRLLEPPFCYSTKHEHKAGHWIPLVLQAVLFLAVLLSSCACCCCTGCGCVWAPYQLKPEELRSRKAREMGGDHPLDCLVPPSRGRGRPRAEHENGRSEALQALEGHLRDAWKSKELLPELGYARMRHEDQNRSIADYDVKWQCQQGGQPAEHLVRLFLDLQAVFGFQVDNVWNQFEHLLSLWRSQCSMCADETLHDGRAPPGGLLAQAEKEGFLLNDGLKRLHDELLGDGGSHKPSTGYSGWRRRFDRRYREPSGPREGQPINPSEAHLEKLREISVFLLVQGEAGNVRFMPEVLYLITYLALKINIEDYNYGQSQNKGKKSVYDDNTPPHSTAFLERIIRPLYAAIFDESYKGVKVADNGTSDKKEMFKGFGQFIPADCANYDDWNELFCDCGRLRRALVFREEDGNAQLLLQPESGRVPEHGFEKLHLVDWHHTLRGSGVAGNRAAAATKTHREVHSLWGVFAGVHRICFVHVAMYVLIVTSVCCASSPHTGELLPVGSSAKVNFATASLVVPGHVLCWRLARKFTGKSSWLLGLVLLAVPPVLSYAWVRLAEASGDHGALDASLSVHFTLSWLLALFAILKAPPSIFLTPWMVLDREDVVWREDDSEDVWRGPCGFFWYPAGAQRSIGWDTWERQKEWFRFAARYLVLAVILSLKWWFGKQVVASLDQVMRELAITRLLRAPWDTLRLCVFHTTFDKDALEWFILWGSGLVVFIVDTQMWVIVGCTLLGVVVFALHLGEGAALGGLRGDVLLHRLPEQFSKKVLYHATQGGRRSEGISPFFPPLWDKIVEIMRYEDKLDEHTYGELSFTPRRAPIRPIGGERPEPVGRDIAALGEDLQVLRPAIFEPMGVLERTIRRDMGLFRDSSWPANAEMQWRLLALARSVSLDIPKPFRAPYLPGLSVLVPHYGEQILYKKEDLYKTLRGREAEEGEQLMTWIERRYSDELKNFAARMRQHAGRAEWPTAGNRWSDPGYDEQNWAKIGKWASMRSQTVWRTVAGLRMYHHVLRNHYQIQRLDVFPGAKNQGADAGARFASEVFTLVLSMQLYAYDDNFVRDAELLLDRFGRSGLKIAYIGKEDIGPKRRGDADADNVHPRQERRYFSCLLDHDSPKSGPKSGGRRQPRFRVELPGYPILGDGKGDNQNHAIIFCWGSLLQVIDANQGAYFEQLLLYPCALGELRKNRGGSRKILGFAEHITSDFGTVGDLAAGSEMAFGTILQRSYATLGARMHYGHPDIFNKCLMMQQGGVSKATKTLHLSEDIFAGMDFTLRGGPGKRIEHHEYFHLGKGRDLAFGKVLEFFSKLASGTGEQLLTRQVQRLGETMGLAEFFFFYYAHGGFYLQQFIVSSSVQLLTYVWLLMILDDNTRWELEQPRSGAEVMADFLGKSFTLRIGVLSVVAHSAPLLVESWLQSGLFAAVRRVVKQLFTCGPVFFLFKSKLIGNYIVNEFLRGGAEYKATGRGLPVERRPFIAFREDLGGSCWHLVNSQGEVHSRIKLSADGGTIDQRRRGDGAAWETERKGDWEMAPQRELWSWTLAETCGNLWKALFSHSPRLLKITWRTSANGQDLLDPPEPSYFELEDNGGHGTSAGRELGPEDATTAVTSRTRAGPELQDRMTLRRDPKDLPGSSWDLLVFGVLEGSFEFKQQGEVCFIDAQRVPFDRCDGTWAREDRRLHITLQGQQGASEAAPGAAPGAAPEAHQFIPTLLRGGSIELNMCDGDRRARHGRDVSIVRRDPVKHVGLYQDYAPQTFYDGVRLLAGLILVWLAHGLQVKHAALSLGFWCSCIILTACSWLWAPFIFNPYQFSYWRVCDDWDDWKAFFHVDGGRPWIAWYENARLKPERPLRAMPLHVAVWMVLIGSWYSVLMNQLHLVTMVTADNTVEVLARTAWALYPPMISLVACLLYAWLVHVRPDFARGLLSSTAAVAFLDICEVTWNLWDFAGLAWWKTLTVGLLLKYTFLSAFLALAECAFSFGTLDADGVPRNEKDKDYNRGCCLPSGRRVGRGIKLWLYSHMMLVDLVVSLLIFSVIGVLAFGDLIRSSFCRGCRCQQLLIFRGLGQARPHPLDFGRP